MKKIILIGIVVTLLSALACRKPAEVIETSSLPTNEPTASATPLQTDNSGAANPTVMPMEDRFEYGIPHDRLVLYNVEKYLLLASSIELDDAECEEFLYKNFFASGIETKADAIKALEDINSLPFIPIDGFEFKYFEFDYSKNCFFVRFRDKADEARFFGFEVALTSSDSEAERRELAQYDSFVELPETRSSELKYLARSWVGETGDPNYPYTIRNFTTSIRSHKIKMQTNLSEKEVVDILANCEIITMDEYAKKANP